MNVSHKQNNRTARTPFAGIFHFSIQYTLNFKRGMVTKGYFRNLNNLLELQSLEICHQAYEQKESCNILIWSTILAYSSVTVYVLCRFLLAFERKMTCKRNNSSSFSSNFTSVLNFCYLAVFILNFGWLLVLIY